MRCRYPHGLGGLQPPAGCFASGENDKKEAVRECILSAALFFVFIAPVGSLFGSQSFVRKEEGGKSFLLRRMGAGPMALLPGVRGLHKPLLPFSQYFLYQLGITVFMPLYQVRISRACCCITAISSSPKGMAQGRLPRLLLETYRANVYQKYRGTFPSK